VVAGGVACNQHIRSQLSRVAEEGGVCLVLPPPKWCTDNGVMVAWAGMERCVVVVGVDVSGWVWWRGQAWKGVWWWWWWWWCALMCLGGCGGGGEWG
jgi:hypothetical protein